MSPRVYWSQRQGRGPRGAPSLTDLYRSVALLGAELSLRSYFQEQYGYECVDGGSVSGAAGISIALHIESQLGYQNFWPPPADPFNRDPEWGEEPTPEEYRYAEDCIFDLIEFLHDHVSSGIEEEGRFHAYAGCGWHYRLFDPEPAREFFRDRINVVLGNYNDGYALTDSGQIEHLVPAAMEGLMAASSMTEDEAVDRRINAATSAWRSRERTDDSMREAVRNLFDVLERLRPQVKEHMLQADENDLFNIANNFAIRHFNAGQRTDWESPTWLSWMFYVNLSTLHLVTRLIRRQANREGSQ